MASSVSNIGGAMIAVAGLIGLCAGGAKAQEPHGFTFSQAEFMSTGGLRAANAFVAQALPPGLPMREAIARAERADTSCKAAPRGMECEYFIPVRPAGGDLGEDVWSLHLIPGPDGLLQAAYVRRYHVGQPGLQPGL